MRSIFCVQLWLPAGQLIIGPLSKLLPIVQHSTIGNYCSLHFTLSMCNYVLLSGCFDWKTTIIRSACDTNVESGVLGNSYFVQIRHRGSVMFLTTRIAFIHLKCLIQQIYFLHLFGQVCCVLQCLVYIVTSKYIYVLHVSISKKASSNQFTNKTTGVLICLQIWWLAKTYYLTRKLSMCIT